MGAAVITLERVDKGVRSHGMKRHFRETVGRRGEEIGRRLQSDRTVHHMMETEVGHVHGQ